MKDRLLKFMNREQLSSARFADSIGVQPSSISHILSGRNNPGFDFIYKTLKRYPHLNAEWLIMGKGSMIKSPAIQGELFSEPDTEIEDTSVIGLIMDGSDDSNSGSRGKDGYENGNASDTNVKTGSSDSDYKSNFRSPGKITDVNTGRIVEKIIVFYTDKSFHEYAPAPAEDKTPGL